MSTVMGQVNKDPLRLVIILANDKSEKTYCYLRKLRVFVEWIAKKFAELFLSAREDFEFRGFEVVTYSCTIAEFRKQLLSLERNKPDIFLNVLVGKFSHFISSNRNFLNYFLVPDRFIKSLPADLENEVEWSNKMRCNLSELLSHLIHEICHSLGGFHAEEGIMGRHFDLLSDDDTKLGEIKFIKFIDKKTMTIICESMSIITTLRPQRNLTFNEGELTYYTDQSIAAVFFVNENRYTSSYKEFTYLDAMKTYTEKVPETWDGFVVIHFCGHIIYYSKADVTTTRRCTKKMEF
ncbi:hypothetical protein GCK72_023889 [Caenorhabditis remanei]|uniref:Uncharacterized protein n=1 Tax=Caenorhabditis remanei TaxID=31234 RepID=E3M2I7_CAERE|nr:hypothetical protein GCK72_023889 [Caenorhabditis remanei]EFO89864.1 hypothetical protein CRE_07366 [Caenorhabditis remanei]KAF1747427.1 hypothetical protein GCK72_023889 [Caenorhabditis remanei]